MDQLIGRCLLIADEFWEGPQGPSQAGLCNLTPGSAGPAGLGLVTSLIWALVSPS